MKFWQYDLRANMADISIASLMGGRPPRQAKQSIWGEAPFFLFSFFSFFVFVLGEKANIDDVTDLKGRKKEKKLNSCAASSVFNFVRQEKHDTNLKEVSATDRLASQISACAPL